ncbi:hypothetical membrane protein [Pelotomaculum thermopropionicum SI]|uniref:Hypothetical membrane protein n=1 Tax=Pelotomaculum thermopropionicum (strain DSM 13744 / JCM 10971 / SI) TaxID=370438 RepID=A5D5Y6_PELTS|nr:hypothetical membrane protein [Pelotomaculum thermopropionicum SI]
MLKRLFAVAAVFFLLIAALPAFAGQLFDAQTAINDALDNSDYYLDVSKNGHPINYVSIPILSNYLKGGGYYGCLVYGDPHGDYKDGQYRYLGYTLDGEDYTNVAFPPDASHTGYFEDQQWIIWPWADSDVTANYTIEFNNNLDGTNRYAQNIRQGILVYYTDPNNANNYQVKGIAPETLDFWDNIHQYIHVLAPPTKWAWGIGRMFRYGSGGQINYITVPLMPDALIEPPAEDNLKAVSLDLGIPPGQLAEPGTQYRARAEFQNESARALTEVPVAVLHGDYQATLHDEKGQPLPKKMVGGKEVQVADFGPGESRTFWCDWHPFNQARDGLTAIINRDEIGKVHLETTYEDNIITKETVVDFKDLSVQILEYAKEAYAGNPVTVKAKVINSTGRMVVTKLVWKVNGSVVKEVPNFDIISEYDDAVTFDMPGAAAEVTVEVNPDRNAPPNEASWDNNADSCSVKLLREKLPDEDSRLKVSIDAPSFVNYKENFTFRVTVSAYVPPPPPLSDFEPPTVSVTTTTSGGKLTWLYNYVDGSMENYSFEEQFNDSFTAYGGRWTTETYTYTQRGCGIKGQEHDIIIEATAKMEGRTARDVKKVRVAAMPILPVGQQLTQ